MAGSGVTRRCVGERRITLTLIRPTRSPEAYSEPSQTEALPERLNVVIRHKFTAFGLRDALADGRAGLLIEIVRADWPFLGEGEQNGTQCVLILCGKRPRLGDCLV